MNGVWMNEWVNEWMDMQCEWVNEWMSEWICGVSVSHPPHGPAHHTWEGEEEKEKMRWWDDEGMKKVKDEGRMLFVLMRK